MLYALPSQLLMSSRQSSKISELDRGQLTPFCGLSEVKSLNRMIFIIPSDFLRSYRSIKSYSKPDRSLVQPIQPSLHLLPFLLNCTGKQQLLPTWQLSRHVGSLYQLQDSGLSKHQAQTHSITKDEKQLATKERTFLWVNWVDVKVHSLKYFSVVLYQSWNTSHHYVSKNLIG